MTDQYSNMIYLKGCGKEATHERVGSMTPFIQSSRTGKTTLW